MFIALDRFSLMILSTWDILPLLTAWIWCQRTSTLGPPDTRLRLKVGLTWTGEMWDCVLCPIPWCQCQMTGERTSTASGTQFKWKNWLKLWHEKWLEIPFDFVNYQMLTTHLWHFISVGNLKQKLKWFFSLNQSQNFSYWIGPSIDIISALSKAMNFTYSYVLPKDGHWGSQDPKTGDWNGMIGMLIDGKCDIW